MLRQHQGRCLHWVLTDPAGIVCSLFAILAGACANKLSEFAAISAEQALRQNLDQSRDGATSRPRRSQVMAISNYRAVAFALGFAVATLAWPGNAQCRNNVQGHYDAE